MHLNEPVLPLPLPLRRSLLDARNALAHDDVAIASHLFDELAAAVPTDIEVKLYAAWARARLASSVTEAERDALHALAREALGTHASLALPLNVLAHAALQRGELVVARRLFRRAAEADPSLIDARRGSRLVAQRLEKRTHDGAGIRRLRIALALVSSSVTALVRP